MDTNPVGRRATIDANYHPRVTGGWIGTRMYEITSPVAPEAFRRETGLSPSGYRSTTHKVPLMSIVAGQPVSGEVSALEEVVDASAPASQTRLIAAKDLSATG